MNRKYMNREGLHVFLENHGIDVVVWDVDPFGVFDGIHYVESDSMPVEGAISSAAEAADAMTDTPRSALEQLRELQEKWRKSSECVLGAVDTEMSSDERQHNESVAMVWGECADRLTSIIEAAEREQSGCEHCQCACVACAKCGAARKGA